MFVKLYRFRISKEDLTEYKKIHRAADVIYKKHGAGKSEILLKRDKEFVEITLREYYKSENDFLKITKEVNKDREIKRLWGEFLKLVQGQVVEEDIKTTEL